jgi:transposase
MSASKLHADDTPVPVLALGDDSQLEIDDNAERALRVVALGRKELPLRALERRRRRAVAIYSWLSSAKLNGLDPEFYLHHVLDQIADTHQPD